MNPVEKTRAILDGVRTLEEMVRNPIVDNSALETLHGQLVTLCDELKDEMAVSTEPGSNRYTEYLQAAEYRLKALGLG